MTKKYIFLIVALLISNFSFAQISDRSNDNDTYIIGARPQAGDLGIYLGISTEDISNVIKAIDSDTSWQEIGIPLINIKYYYTDKLVFKVGARAYKKRRSLLQNVISFEIFLKNVKRTKPSFCTYFTNHVAGMMHKYWKDLFTDLYFTNFKERVFLSPYQCIWITNYHE